MFRKKKNKQQGRQPVYSQPAEVFSYHAHRSTGAENRRMPGQPTEHRSELRRWLRLLPTIISISVIIGSIAYATSLSIQPRMQINDSVAAPLLRETVFYEAAAADILKRSVFNYNKLTINTTKLARDLSARYPELGDVAVIIPLSGRRPVIEVTPAQPVLKLSGSGGIFIVDEQGRALIKASEAGDKLGTSVPYVVDQSGLSLEEGKQVLPLHTMDFIRVLTVQMQAKGFQIESLTLPPIPNEIHLHLIGQGYFIKFDTQGAAREQSGTFIATQAKLQAESALPGEYIDVRVAEKVFYR